MPRRAIRCVVELNLHGVSAPGCWLPSKEDCYLSLALFSQYKNTQLLSSVFPILVNEKFRFEKTYFTALDEEEVIELLEDELVVIELLQMSEYSDGAVHLATYTNNVRDFLYPFETYRPTVHSRDRDIFLERTVAFPGISPKLEFSSKVVVKESYSDDMDALEDAIDYHKNTLKRLRRSKRRPRSCSPRRTPSPTLHQRIEDLTLYHESDVRPPFVVRKLDTDLIGRQPGGVTDQNAKSKPHKCIRLNKFKPGTDYCPLCYDAYTLKCCSICQSYKRHLGRLYWGHDKHYHPAGHICRSYQNYMETPTSSRKSPIYGYKKYFDDDDDDEHDDDSEVAELTSRVRDYGVPYRTRSVSPGNRQRSLSPSSRRIISPSSRLITAPRSRKDLYDSPLNRRLPNVRISREYSPRNTYYGRDDVERSHRYRYPTHDTLDDLALDTSLAKYRSQVHIDNGHYWTERAAELSGKSHRELFNDNISKIYNRLNRKARTLR
ncbi:spermatogenesis-associated protein 6 isoform X10 [Patella vulgata]|uniref:spermatogenesis-associated protein 6 isoform X10 n=1 Tax=Patella vulgata TaxID=6465 RepID=UPI00217FD489|nr:spermatogenesis-associated protein 6 isoform X10 [Patella vulgata]